MWGGPIYIFVWINSKENNHGRKTENIELDNL